MQQSPCKRNTNIMNHWQREKTAEGEEKSWNGNRVQSHKVRLALSSLGTKPPAKLPDWQEAKICVPTTANALSKLRELHNHNVA